MSIIDWGALDRNGMPAFMAALKALEARVEAQDHETARDMREAANLVGVDVVEYSRMERGLSDPTRAERALEANGA